MRSVDPHRPDDASIMERLRERTGLTFTAGRRQEVEAAIRRAADRATAGDLTAFAKRISVDEPVLDELIAELTVGETYFFREPAQLEFIRREAIPQILRHRAGGSLRAWSAGCASGEEAYSLAILLREAAPGVRAHVVGTDLARHRLVQARRARYTRWALRGVPPAAVGAYFQRVGGQFALVSAVRESVEFRYLNLAEDAYPSLATGIWGMDLILCRNVLIYLDRETIATVARRLIDSLGDGGWLFLGASDPPLSDLVPCEVVVTGAGVAYRRARRGAPTGSIRTDPPAPATATFGPSPAKSAPVPPRAAPDPVPAPVVEEAAVAYVAHDYPRAVELARAEVARGAGDPATWVVLVRALSNQGKLEEAGRACSAALEHHRTSAELVYLHAVLLAEAGRHADAAAAARRALYLDRRLAVAHLALGSALARQGDVDGARRALRNAERLLASLPPEEIVPASDGEPAGRLAEMARVQLRLVPKAIP